LIIRRICNAYDLGRKSRNYVRTYSNLRKHS
ncbi:MAG: hypothetical protein ACI8VI_000982, partial [Granulosicoccus sp.]